jgi:hypothetical protein
VTTVSKKSLDVNSLQPQLSSGSFSSLLLDCQVTDAVSYTPSHRIITIIADLKCKALQGQYPFNPERGPSAGDGVMRNRAVPLGRWSLLPWWYSRVCLRSLRTILLSQCFYETQTAFFPLVSFLPIS